MEPKKEAKLPEELNLMIIRYVESKESFFGTYQFVHTNVLGRKWTTKITLKEYEILTRAYELTLRNLNNLLTWYQDHSDYENIEYYEESKKRIINMYQICRNATSNHLRYRRLRRNREGVLLTPRTPEQPGSPVTPATLNTSHTCAEEEELRTTVAESKLRHVRRIAAGQVTGVKLQFKSNLKNESNLSESRTSVKSFSNTSLNLKTDSELEVLRSRTINEEKDEMSEEAARRLEQQKIVDQQDAEYAWERIRDMERKLMQEKEDRIQEELEYEREKRRESREKRLSQAQGHSGDVGSPGKDEGKRSRHSSDLDSHKSHITDDDVFEARYLPKTDIGKFYGNKREFSNWYSRFEIIIDNAKVSTSYKLLKLREALGGEARQTIDALGHSSAAYTMAKTRLLRKYGGIRRQLEIRLDDLANQKIVREGNPKELEKFAELLDVLIVTLTDAKQESELGAGAFYISLQRKLSENLLVKYAHWLSQFEKEENVTNLKDFVDEESRYAMHAAELTRGMSKLSVEPEKPKRESGNRSYLQYGAEGKDPVNQKVDSNTNENKKYWDTKCRQCGSLHKLWQCTKFKQMSFVDKWKKVVVEKICFKCLGGTHRTDECKRTVVCGRNGCSSVHNRLLHSDRSNKTENVTPKTENKMVKPNPTNNTENLCLSAKAQGFLALRTVPIILENKQNHKFIKVNAILDDGSSKTYLNQDIAEHLNLKGKMEPQTVRTLNGGTTNLIGMTVNCTIKNLDSTIERESSMFTVHRVTGFMTVIDWTKKCKEWKHLSTIPFPILGKRAIVDCLIGLDNCDLHSPIKPEVYGAPGEPIARLTPLGWTCVGNTPGGNDIDTQLSYHAREPEEAEMKIEQLENQIKRYWVEEEVQGPEQTMSPHDKTVLEATVASMKQVDGRFQVSLPWKNGRPGKMDCYAMALRRLKSTENTLRKNGEALCLKYDEIFKTYLKKGYIRKVTEESDLNRTICLIAHFPVINMDKETTKIRIVFDASVKIHGISLNEMIETGPKLQQDLLQVLTRFRRYLIALSSDISEMYLQILLAPDDRPAQRFLWRDLQDRHPDVYESLMVMFGNRASPFMAIATTLENAEQQITVYPRAVETIKESTYMDDSLDSVMTTDEAVQLYKDLIVVWKKAHMIPRKWVSNSLEVMKIIPIEDRVQQVDLANKNLPVTKTLGIRCEAETDIFRFIVKALKGGQRITKRTFLGYLATIFDPLGFISPVTVMGKIWLQRMWREGVEWDSEPSLNIVQGIQYWLEELNQLDLLHIPRAIITRENFVKQEVHTFSDASLEAYAACTYVKTIYPDHQEVRLVLSKARVAPLRSISVPRLELMGAMLGLRLAEKIVRIFEIAKKDTYYWTDSVDILQWIKNLSRKYKPFVANRVGQIHEQSDPQQWWYVGTEENPADLPSRGVLATKLVDSKIWWEGPEYLQLGKENWPMKNIVYAKVDVEERPNFEPCFLIDAGANLKTDWNIRELGFAYSSIKTLYTQERGLAWLLRFVNNCRAKSQGRNRITGELEVQELKVVHQQLLRVEQKEMFKEEISSLNNLGKLKLDSKLRGVRPFLDNDGVMRAQTRLSENVSLSWNVRYPTILHKNGIMTRLIVKQEHEKYFHQGTSYILNKLNLQYWMLAPRDIIRSVEKSCQYCRRRAAKPITQLMAPLPPMRSERTIRPFINCSVDFAGPFSVKVSRGRTVLKRYLCLFSCLAVRAVHLELCYDMTTECFLNALMRMIARRGCPETILSDNGSNFVGAEKELRELIFGKDKRKIAHDGTKRGIQWFFNPPCAPHHNGVHEAMVKIAKRNIQAIIGNVALTDEELLTSITIAEGLINTRPLTYQTSNEGDLRALTPNDFIIGRLGGNAITQQADSTNFKLTSRWRRMQDLQKQFWKRWTVEWLSSLRARSKWTKDPTQIKIGQVVIVSADNSPRGTWPLGRIVQVYPGPDQIIRVVDIKVNGRVFRRPITKLCVLEAD